MCDINDEMLVKLQEKIVCMLCKLEAVLPSTSLVPMFHAMLHMAQQMALIGPASTVWCDCSAPPL